jgi:hypothetical protein
MRRCDLPRDLPQRGSKALFDVGYRSASHSIAEASPLPQNFSYRA